MLLQHLGKWSFAEAGKVREYEEKLSAESAPCVESAHIEVEHLGVARTDFGLHRFVRWAAYEFEGQREESTFRRLQPTRKRLT